MEEKNGLKIEEVVAIIGGGVGGILSMKQCKENNLKYHLYEKKGSLLGLWSEQGFVWDKIKSNVSQYSCQLQGLYWEEKEVSLLRLDEIRLYLKKYIEKFSLTDESDGNQINLNCNIQKISQKEHDYSKYYEIAVQNPKNKEIRILNYSKVIIATGSYNSFNIPQIKDIKNFKGKIIHSGDYKSPMDFVDKKVLIVGFSLSAGNISEEIARCKEENPELSKNSNQVFISCRRSAYIFPVLCKSNDNKKSESIDIKFLRRKNDEYKEHYFESKKQFDKYVDDSKSFFDLNINSYKHLSQLCKERKFLDENLQYKINVTFIDKFIKCFEDGFINLLGPINRIIDGKTIEFKKDVSSQKELNNPDYFETLDFDSIIFCTGFKNKLDYLDATILNDLEFDSKNRHYPVVLYKGVYNNKHLNMLFVGMFAGFWTGLELQAKYAARVLSKRLSLPDKENYELIMEKEKLLKMLNDDILSRPFDYLAYNDTLAMELNCYVNLPNLKQINPELYNLLMSIPVFSTQYELFEKMNELESLKERDNKGKCISNHLDVKDNKLNEYVKKQKDIEEIISYLKNIQKYF